MLALLAFAAAPAGAAVAAPPTISSPTDGSVINDRTPTFTGTTGAAEEELLENGVVDRVTVVVRTGTKAEKGKVAEEMSTDSPVRGLTWSVGPIGSLPPGTYTAQVEDREVLVGTEVTLSTPSWSAPITFTIDTTPPKVTLTSPADGSTTISSSQAFAGGAGTAPGDLPAITIQLFAGPTIGAQSPLEGVEVQATPAGSWSATLGGLAPGTYSVRAVQADEAGNNGVTPPITFTVTAPPPPPPPTPPHASFKWFPATPIVGETVSLVSNSTDDTSPLTAFAWALTGNAPFSAGKPVLTTSFSTPGDHPVRLRVTSADGLSGITTETIHVISRPLALMAPFPIVRIAGIVTSTGVNLSLLTVQAPVGVRVKVTCHGGGCPRASESRVASSTSRQRRASTVVITFRRFQASLRAGAVLEIRVFRQGLIGKYTRFVIRRGRLPLRVDSCVGQAGIKPMACPS